MNREYLKQKVNEMDTNSKENISETYRDIHSLKRGINQELT